MSETLIISIVAGILTIFGGAGFWSYKASRAETPLKQGAHDLALVSTANAALAASIASLREQMDQQDKRIDVLEADLEEERTERRNFADRLERWAIWYQQLAQGWETHRQKPNAPQSPDNIRT